MTEVQAQTLEARERMEERLVTEAMRASVSECAAQCSVPDVHEPADRVRGLERRFRSGFSDLAEAHDQHLDDAFGW